jgi:energy-coupling factor transport system ATP-binding protein
MGDGEFCLDGALNSRMGGHTTVIIDSDNLHYRYPGAEADALAGLDLRVEEGEFVAVVGPNGSGKSTLARLLGGLDKATGGRCLDVCGHDLLTVAGRRDVRRDVGVLFQNPENQLVAENVEEDIAFGLENLAWPAPQIAARVEQVLTDFGLNDLRRREPHLLSGGQKQRVALAGVLAIPRRVLVLDEPTAMLDPAGRDEILAAVTAAHRDGLTVVYVTQEMDEVPNADRVIALEAGAAVFAGPAEDLFGNADLVRRLALGLPIAGEVALALQERGAWPRDRLALSLDDLVSVLDGVRAAGFGAGAPSSGSGPDSGSGNGAGRSRENGTDSGPTTGDALASRSGPWSQQ